MKPQPPVMIAVMGKTGTGKTSFVNAITEKGLTVGHGLDSCTQDIQTANTTINGREVCLVDTPGFDDTNRSDADILSTIADWVQQANHERKHFSGIIYFHRIVDTRMEGSNMKNLRMFRELCGEKNFSNVILCTTMWDKVEEEEGRRREQELESKETFWGSLVSRGAQVMRHRGPDFAASARKIAESLIQKDTIVLQLQEELDKNGTLSDTSAGRLLTGAIEGIKEKHQEEMAALKAEMEASNKKKKEAELLRKQHEQEAERLRKAAQELERRREEEARRFNEEMQRKQHEWKNRPEPCIIL
ncbi:P-loop containing nucleoside triphosphate hydrolase protein [Tuber borchii]|uniref:P-loop containing nucleoside triphosphate hydrolase protein n=1 Tax=Tuber borchii TaxID=42251 RepID=A0A2T6ZCU6_TUBBO|nr:P-loop containing nucleoside triphosphate hydrolase protein [Tuber borchii]